MVRKVKSHFSDGYQHHLQPAKMRAWMTHDIDNESLAMNHRIRPWLDSISLDHLKSLSNAKSRSSTYFFADNRTPRIYNECFYEIVPYCWMCCYCIDGLDQCRGR